MSAIAGRVLLIPKGNYDSTATYTMLDMVVYNGSSYICKQECTGVVPTNTTYWMLNASGSAVAYINDIGDVVITNVSNGQVLMYDNATQKWVNGTITTTLAGLTDTQIASLSNGQVLKYNATSQKWENADEKGGILPHLIVISETGSTVTASKGQTVITATETSTGHFECDLPEFGTWTIDAILGGDDAQVSLVVDTVKVYTVDDSHFHATVTVKYPDGATCRLQSADETLYATDSPYTFTVHHAETYTITVTYNQRIYTDTVTFTTEGQSFSKTLPSPSEVDANDINWWLWFGDVSGTFSTLADILADSTALSTLMASTDAVDYLVRCTDWTGKGLVPTMTSNTTPSGECFGSGLSQRAGISNKGDYWKIFNENEGGAGGVADDCAYLDHPLTGAYFGYDFGRDVNIVRAKIKTHTSQVASQVVEIQGYSSTLDTWVTLKTITSSGAIDFDGTFTNANKYSKYRVYLSSTGQTGDYSWIIGHCQFYSESIPDNQSAMSYIGLNNYCADTLLADEDWCEGIANSEYIDSVLNVKVPTMTSNTTPSGVVSSNGTPSDRITTAYQCFDNNESNGWNPYNSNQSTIYVQYMFEDAMPIKLLSYTNAYSKSCNSYKLQGSNDGTNFVDLVEITSGITDETQTIKTVVNNSTEYKYYRVVFVPKWYASNQYYYAVVGKLQFYGRADV